MTAENRVAEPEKTGLERVFEKRIQKERREKNRFRLCFDLIVTAAVVFVLFSVIFGIAVVQGDSMEPSLTSGSLALFYRLDHTYRRNDIVLFRPNGRNELLIKRIVAVAGDTVDIDDQSGTLRINGTAEQEDTVVGKTYSREGGATFPLKVPDGCVFVLGDNREAALDSRSIGTIGARDVVGKVLFEIKKLTG